MPELSTIYDYMRANAALLGARILEEFPALDQFDDAVSPRVERLLRRPFPAQAIAIMGLAKHWQQARTAMVVAECGTRGIVLQVPAGATTLSLGINDTQLYDNTGSFTVQATVMDTTNEWAGSASPFNRYPAGAVAPSFMPDHFSGLSQSVWMACYPPHQMDGGPFSAPFSGQLFPRGAQ